MPNVKGKELTGVALTQARVEATKRLGETMAGRQPADLAEENRQFAAARRRLAEHRRATRPEQTNL